MPETLNGNVAYIHGKRTGSEYLSSAADLIDPIHWADRQRNKLRGRLTWMSSGAMDVQFQTEYSRSA